MYCEKCGAENNGSLVRCIRCGEKLYFFQAESDDFESSIKKRYWFVTALFTFCSFAAFFVLALVVRDYIPDKYLQYSKFAFAMWFWFSYAIGSQVAARYIRT